MYIDARNTERVPWLFPDEEISTGGQTGQTGQTDDYLCFLYMFLENFGFSQHFRHFGKFWIFLENYKL